MQLQFAAATALFEDYVDRPGTYWPPAPNGGDHRQVRKLQRSLLTAAELAQTNTATVVEQVSSLALTRAHDRPAPIYVKGLGGSGSHWLSEMLAELLPAFHAGEVYFPASLLEHVDRLPPVEQGFLADCLHLAHASATPTVPPPPLASLSAARAINAAGGVIHPREKTWDPACSVIHMLRDPRDQVESVVFRKATYRQEVAGEQSDEEYLAQKAKVAIRNLSAWRDSAIEPDAECRYEQLRTAPGDELRRLISCLGARATSERIDQVAKNHDGSLMQAGEVRARGNFFLDDGQGSRRKADPQQRAQLHADLIEISLAAGYPCDECLGSPTPIQPSQAARELNFPPSPLGVLFIRPREHASPQAGWQTLGPAAGEVVLPAGAAVKLRLAEGTSASEVAALTKLPPDGLDALCLAGIPAVDDQFLGMLASPLSGLQELDLAHTAVSGEGLGCLSSLKTLRGLSLLGTSVMPADISTLICEIPGLADCHIVGPS